MTGTFGILSRSPRSGLKSQKRRKHSLFWILPGQFDLFVPARKRDTLTFLSRLSRPLIRFPKMAETLGFLKATGTLCSDCPTCPAPGHRDTPKGVVSRVPLECDRCPGPDGFNSERQAP